MFTRDQIIRQGVVASRLTSWPFSKQIHCLLWFVALFSSFIASLFFISTFTYLRTVPSFIFVPFCFRQQLCATFSQFFAWKSDVLQGLFERWSIVCEKQVPSSSMLRAGKGLWFQFLQKGKDFCSFALSVFTDHMFCSISHQPSIFTLHQSWLPHFVWNGFRKPIGCSKNHLFQSKKLVQWRVRIN